MPKRAIGALGSCNAALTTFAVLPDEAIPEHRLLVPLRGMGRARPLVFRMRPRSDGGGVAVEWQVDEIDSAASGDDTNLTSDHAMSGETALTRACRCLRLLLQPGPMYVKTMEDLATERGHSKATIRRARTTLRLEPRRLVENGVAQSYWQLPAEKWRGQPVRQFKSVQTLQQPAQSPNASPGVAGGGLRLGNEPALANGVDRRLEQHDVDLLKSGTTCSSTCSTQELATDLMKTH